MFLLELTYNFKGSSIQSEIQSLHKSFDKDILVILNVQ
jgi:hypothetical protein